MRLNKLETLAIVLIGIIALSTFVVSKAVAEQSPGTPDSQVDSILKETYNNLQGLGYGSEEGSNGAFWNRIISSANWVPNGTVTEADVVKDKTYFDESRQPKTGSLDFPKYADQSLQSRDFRGTDANSTWASWSLTSGTATAGVYKDNRTGLYWSAKQGTGTNEFNRTSCDFFSTIPRGNYTGSDNDCGTSINMCATLSLDANGDSTPETKWYLPTQAELLTAYLDGMYLGANATWTTGDNYWSSTEDKGSSLFAWRTNLNHGNTNSNAKTSTNSIRCVHRDL